jgi:hypothetical protein
MSEKVEAAACFREGFNCSQAILSTWGGEFGLERETALRAAVREVSIVLSAYFGIVYLGEKHGRQKLIGAALIALGVIAIGLSR